MGELLEYAGQRRRRISWWMALLLAVAGVFFLPIACNYNLIDGGWGNHLRGGSVWWWVEPPGSMNVEDGIVEWKHRALKALRN